MVTMSPRRVKYVAKIIDRFIRRMINSKIMTVTKIYVFIGLAPQAYFS